jgi:hypothetical protein
VLAFCITVAALVTFVSLIVHQLGADVLPGSPMYFATVYVLPMLSRVKAMEYCGSAWQLAS